MQKGSSLTLKKLVLKYLDVLHIKVDHKIGVLSIQSCERISQITDNLGFVAMKIIGDASVKTRHIFTISEINDFLTILANTLNIRKNYKHQDSKSLSTIMSNTKINSKAIKIDSLDRQLKSKDRNTFLSDNNDHDNTILGSLTEITGRNSTDLNSSLSSLSDIDLKRLKDLCNNYDRLRKYCKLAMNEKKFRKEAEKDTGKKLGDNQLYHAVSSVKKVKIYVENVLDHKFEPDESHGINHIKHNLEYGYSLIGLIESSRKPRKLY